MTSVNEITKLEIGKYVIRTQALKKQRKWERVKAGSNPP